MYALTAHILLDVYDPLMRNISIGEFGSYRARQQLEVSMTRKSSPFKDNNVKDQSKVLIHARMICGILLANPGNVPGIITLCHSVFACELRSSIVQLSFYGLISWISCVFLHSCRRAEIIDRDPAKI